MKKLFWVKMVHLWAIGFMLLASIIAAGPLGVAWADDYSGTNPSGTPVTVTLDSTVSSTYTNEGTVYVNGGATLAVSGTLTNSGTSTDESVLIINKGTLEVTSSGKLVNVGTAEIAVRSGGTLLVDAGSTNTTFTNNDFVAVYGNATIKGYAQTTSGGLFESYTGSTVDVIGTLTMDAGSEFRNAGTTKVTGSLILNGVFKNVSGSLNISGGTVTNNGTAWSDNGTTTMTNGTFINNTSAGFNVLNVTAGSTDNYIKGTGLTSITTANVSGSTLKYINTDASSSGYLSINTLNLSGGGVLNVSSAAGLNTDITTASVASGETGTISGGNVSLSNAAVDGTLTVSASLTDFIANGGTISLTKTGTGTLILTGTGSYTDGTTINGGTIQLGANNALGTTGPVTLANTAGVVLDLNGYNQTIGSLSGGGTSGGNVTLGSGILTVGDSTSTTYAGVISGTGSVVKQGDGTLVLTGTNTYSGGTAINGGTLQVSSDSNLGASSGGLSFNGGALNTTASMATARGITLNSGGGTLSPDSGTTLTVSSTITGTGTLTKYGDGTLVLTGTNTHTGGTNINAGTVQISSNANLGDASGTLAFNGGTLNTTASMSMARNVTLSGGGTFNTDASTTLTSSGAISGTGSLTKSGSGTLVLAGTSAYTGGTTVSGGTLQGTTDSLQGNITNNATVAFNQSTDGTYSGTISGTGSLTKSGTGSVNITGDNTYTGTTTIDSGKLSINGSITSPVTINASGTLGGNGTITGNVTNNGTIAPGNSIGTLHINGNYTSGSNSVYQVEVNSAGQSDKIIVSGTATLNGGTVAVLSANNGYSLTTNYTILTAGSVVGTYASVTSDLAFLTPSLSYDPYNVYLTLARNTTDFPGTADTSNQSSVARALDTILGDDVYAALQRLTLLGATDPDMTGLLNAILGMSAAGSRNAYDQLGGLVHTAAIDGTIATFDRYMGIVSSRMGGFLTGGPKSGYAQALGSMLASRTSSTGSDAGNAVMAAMGNAARTDTMPSWGLWAEAYGAMRERRGADTASRFDSNLAGFAFGYDRAISSKLLVGGSLGYGYTKVDMKDLSEKANISSYEASLYGMYRMDPFYISGVAAYGYNRYDTTRNIAFSTISRRASASYAGQSYGASFEGGYRIVTRPVDIIPLVSITGIALNRDSFRERSGGAVNLDAESQTTASLVGALGVKLTKNYSFENGILTPELAIKWRHEFMNSEYSLNASFAGYPIAAFTVRGDRPDRDSADVALGLTWQAKNNMYFYLTYDGIFSGDTTQHAGMVGLRWRW